MQRRSLQETSLQETSFVVFETGLPKASFGESNMSK